MKKHYQILLGIIPLSLSSCLTASKSSSSNMASSSTSAMSWSTNNFPLNIRISTDFSNTERTLISTMANEWEDLGTQSDSSDDYDFWNISGGSITTVSDPGYSDVNSYRDSTLGIYKLVSWPSGFSSTALAVTQLWGVRSGGGINITHFDIFYNLDRYTFYNDTNDAGGASYDIASVGLHELGHALGLSHMTTVSSSESVMYPYLGTGTVHRTIMDCDLKSISANYSLSYSSSLCPQALMTESMEESRENVKEALDIGDVQDGEELSLVMELQPNGTCNHYINGHLYESHEVTIDNGKIVHGEHPLENHHAR